jgi:hypothetical protein
MSADGLQNLWLLFVKNIQNKVSACFNEITYLIVKFLPGSLFRELVTALQLPLVTLK